MRHAILPCVFLVTVTLAGCERPGPGAPMGTASAPVVPVHPASFEPLLHDAARTYGDWDRVSDNLSWSPMLCTPAAPPPVNSMSAAAAGTPHARKLFNLYARHGDEYRAAPAEPARVGQVIVKETWRPSGQATRPLQGRAWDLDGELVWVGEQAELFIMARVDPTTPGTDDGWVYAVMTSDGDRVLRAGALEDCISCHAEQTHRLFGWTEGERQYPWEDGDWEVLFDVDQDAPG